MEQLNELPYEQLIEEDYIWVGTPEDIIERIEQTLEICPGIGEIAITVQRRRDRALDGDQEPGALRVAGRAALRRGGQRRTSAAADRRA